MILDQWAQMWGVSAEAVKDLKHRFGMINTDPLFNSDMSEEGVKSRIRLTASQKGYRLLRNNVGACKDHKGRLIRYGLANDSAQMNKMIKSSDLIGIKPTLITPDMFGQTIGQFVAIECKHANWRWGEDPDRERAQLKFIEIVVGLGGLAFFATGDENL